MPTAQPTISSWAKALEDSLQQRSDIVPEGWATCKAIADELGKAENTVVRQLGDLMRAGKAESRRFRIPYGNAIKSIPHYKLK